jgi:hypothetical protein
MVVVVVMMVMVVHERVIIKAVEAGVRAETGGVRNREQMAVRSARM